MFDRWPGAAAEDALNELVTVIDAEIDENSDENKRSKLASSRDLLLGAGRDVALAYFEKKIMGL
jgi:hypothetical protein